MKTTKLTYKELEKRSAVLEAVVEALRHHEVDAVVGEKKISLLLLPEVTEELRKSEAALAAMFELPSIGMFQADKPAFRFTRVNRKFCEMMGYTAEELLGKSLIGVTHQRDRRRGMIELSRMLHGRVDSWSIEKRCVRKDGTIITVNIDGTMLRDQHGQAFRIMAMIRQIKKNQSVGKGRR